MPENNEDTAGQIRKAVSVIRELRPAYKTLLDFYGQIFVAQETSKSRTHIIAIQIPEEVLSVKIREEFPLISMSEFAIDTEAYESLSREICSIAERDHGNMAVPAKMLIHAADTGKIELRSLFSGLLEGNSSFFEEIAGELGIEKNSLAFLTYNSIKPSLSLCAEQLSGYLDKDNKWEKGYCPICGNPPAVSSLEGEGERFLFCGFCWHKWHVPRLFCPFCDNRDGKTLRYFYSEEEKEYRADVCDKCKKYVKTVDTRKIERMFHPPLEHISTLHLDMQAKDMGLESGVQTGL